MIQQRQDIPEKDKWNLGILFSTEEDWEKAFLELQGLLPEIENLKGLATQGKEQLKKVWDYSLFLDRKMEKLGEYAHLCTAENVSDAKANERMGRFMALATQAGSLFSFLNPELQSIQDSKWNEWLKDSCFDNDRIALNKIRRYKPYVLSAESERILALGMESRSAVQKTFSNLTNADLNFGTMDVGNESLPLTQSTYSLFLQNPDSKIRKAAYEKFYAQFSAHANTLSALYEGSVQQDVYLARARNFPSARAMALYPDDVPESVYDNLVKTVRAAFPVLHRYYKIRKKALKIDRLHHSDVYAPLVPESKVNRSFDQAESLVLEAVKPLGENYGQVLKNGFASRWVDRYENKGKRSGAFSSGCYEGPPYILMNYKEEDLRDVFTLAHEAGHSMHTWHSVQNNPFQHYSYTIFEAEVASTFNEQLLAHVLLEKSNSDKEKAAILSKLIEDTVATLFRQTMFAEFEALAHGQAEAGGGLTLEFLTSTYGQLLKDYFGPEVDLEEYSALECLRIPHFYNAFYVYKYATGLSAAQALSSMVLQGGDSERSRYLSFLKSGGSRFPLESLKLAGVDLSTPEPIQRAVDLFSKRLDQLEKLLG